MKNSGSTSIRPAGSDRPAAALPSPGLFFFSSFLSVAAGIIIWYQFACPILFLPLVPLPAIFLYTGHSRTIVLAAALFFLLLGNLRASFAPAIETVGPVTGRGIVSSIPAQMSRGTRATVTVTSASLPLPSTVTAYFDGRRAPAAGDGVRFAGEVRSVVRYRNLDRTPSFVRNFESGKTFLRVKSFSIEASSPFFTYLDGVRTGLQKRFTAYTGSGGGFFREVLFGDPAVASAERRLFAATGTAHILSISGLHFALTVSLAFAAVWIVQLLLPRIIEIAPRPLLVTAAALPLLALYAFLSGMSVPAARSFVIFAAGSVFVLLKKHPDPLTLLSLAAIAFLLHDPDLLFHLSFQLSFTCVFVLVAFSGKIRTWSAWIAPGNRVVRYIAGTVIASFLISVFLVPFIQPLSPQASVAGIIANPFVIPLFSFLVLPFLFCALPLAAHPSSLFDAALFLPETGWRLMLTVIEGTDHLTSRLAIPFSFDFTTAVAYVAGVAACFLLSGKKRLVAAVACAAGVFLLSPASVPGPFISFLDVGQGDGAFVKTERGKVILIDTGGNIWDDTLFQRAYRPFMDAAGTRAVEAVVISHRHPDHWKALPDIAARYPVRNIYVSARDADVVAGLVDGSTTALHAIRRPQRIELDDITLTLIPPPDNTGDTNDASLWVDVEIRERRILFVGDTGRKTLGAMLSRLQQPADTDAVKVPHHGSRSSAAEEFYDALSPSVAVISVGNRNPWGLPSPVVTEMLQSKGIDTFRTDRDGQVTIRFGSNGRLRIDTQERKLGQGKISVPRIP